jgi:hypothetical protein
MALAEARPVGEEKSDSGDCHAGADFGAGDLARPGRQIKLLDLCRPDMVPIRDGQPPSAGRPFEVSSA